jgi:hypothetical protein
MRKVGFLAGYAYNSQNAWKYAVEYAIFPVVSS